ncbi:MAG TPA: threonine synthase [Acidimicrobiia bacterium]
MSHVTDLVCTTCAKPVVAGALTCQDDGGTLDVRYDYETVGRVMSPDTLSADRNPTMWRYRALLPIEDDAHLPPLTVGGTPLYAAPRLAIDSGVGAMWIKDETRQPTGSLKDRASALAVVKAREAGAKVVTTASTGNAAAALAGISASVGQENVIFVPDAAPEAKIAQLLAYGSRLVLVRGNYAAAFDLCSAAVARYGWYDRNTGINPYMTEGKKTVALEILEQLEWSAPDVILVSVGDGSIIGGVHKGVKDALALGWIERMPRLIGVQAEGSDYMAQAYESGENVTSKPPIEASTIADSISADLPRDRVKALAAVTETGGAYLRVTDEEILAAIPLLARGSGVFAEPAGAAAYAGLLAAKRLGHIGGDDEAVVIATGSGLKDVASARRATAAETPIHVAPDIDELARALEP